MFNLNLMKKQLVVFACAAAGMLVAGSVYAANPEPVTVEVEFVAPVTITETNALQYGLLDVTMANLETVVIAPGGGVTDAAGNILGGTQAPATFTVTATGSQAIDILVDNIVANTGYSLGGFNCIYDGGASTGCDGGGYSTTSAAAGSATLEVGATLTGDGAAAAGAQNGSFDVTISYQ